MNLQEKIVPFIIIFIFSIWNQLSGQELADYSYEELVEEALRFGLDTGGNRLVLEERLRNILKLREVAEGGGRSSQNTLAEINNADFGSYIRRGNSNEIELQGNVQIVVRDELYSVEHTITADLIVYNQDRSQLSAEGDVVYTMVGSNRNERFAGDQLLFLLNENETLFFGGGGENEGTVPSEAATVLGALGSPSKVQYHYNGEFISRNLDNIIIMDKGWVSSTRNPSPTYRIQFERLWILSPGEWGAEGLVLYIGNIPVIGLPFLYLPGNEIVFNPVVVLNDIRGLGLTTTTYLLGKKPKSDGDNPFSFLQVGTDGDESELELLGIFLQPVQNSNGNQETDTEKQEELANNLNGKDGAQPSGQDAEGLAVQENIQVEDILNLAKIYFDVYANRGIYLGSELTFQPREPISNTDLFILLALTKELYPPNIKSDNNTSTSLYRDPSSPEGAVYTWHETKIGDISIPLRFAFSLNLSLRLSAFSLGISLPIYSDPYILSEFQLGREENIPWGDLLFGARASTAPTTFTQQAMNWSLDFNLSPSLPNEIRPLFNNLGISNMRSQFTWKIKTIPNETLDPKHRTAIAGTSPKTLEYAPSLLQLPSGSISISGEILRIPFASTTSPVETEENSAIPENISQFEIPNTPETDYEATSSQETNAKDNTHDKEYQAPENSLSISTPSAITPFGYLLSYSASNRHSLTLYFDEFSKSETTSTSTSTATNNTEYDLAYNKFEDDVSANLSQNINFFGSFLSIRSGLNYNGSFKEPFGFSARLKPEDLRTITDREKSIQTHRFELSNNLTLNLLSPFYTDLSLGANYTLNMKLWESSKKDDGSMATKDFAWEKEFVTSHQIGANLGIPLFNRLLRNTFSFSYRLPPLDESVTLGYNFNLEPLGEDLKFTFAGGLSFASELKNEILRPKTISANISTSILSEISFNSRFNWEFENEEFKPKQFNLGFTLFWYNTNIDFRDRSNITLNASKTAWLDASTGSEFRLSTMNHNLRIPISFNESDIIKLNSSINVGWSHDFYRFTESRLTFGLTFDILFPKFLQIKFSVNSVNNNIFQYFPDLSSQVGLQPKDFFTDLFKSFNFFDNNDREETDFKVQSVGFEILHDLENWTLRIAYNWAPRIRNQSGASRYFIENKFSFFLQWLPIEDIENDIDLEIVDDQWKVNY